MRKLLLCTTAFWLVFMLSSAVAITLSTEEKIGRHLYQDTNLSLNGTQSCATCHHRSAGFADPSNRQDPVNSMVSLGDDGVSLGGRNAPTSAYCGYSPILQEVDGEWFGGMFWDGRATGYTLGDPLAEQAQGPPLNPVEMNLPSIEVFVERVEASDYAHLLLDYYGRNFFSKPEKAYDEMAHLIAAYERSAELNAFTSRYDRGELTANEANGLAAFQKARCDACHSLDVPQGAPGAVFTSYGYANIGVPNNYTVNPSKDYGLGYTVGPEQNGKFKIPTLRNITRTPPYSHNGYFATLEEMVRFHLDRGGLVPDVEDNLVDPVTVELAEQEISDLLSFLDALTDEGL
ncbi:Cytochrome c peroxidase [Malonomonas rubra DSM 5091]|uniref:Cytochrome c peroxidase n=1 Tax=Malonomonas rubra DSM 5091 TaxID=1122189 RepID=A0A1M6HCU4_MALRU|nr:cytochrome c peroxidase [Malonomonas rubra]SHJ20045.1 Cytochrome c peroxidase [Malonomonas rubra DSM 5091]